MNRLLSSINESLVDEVAKDSNNSRLIRVIHRQVRSVPVAENAKPFKFRPHNTDMLTGIVTTGSPDVSRAHLTLFLSELSVNLEFYR